MAAFQLFDTSTSLHMTIIQHSDSGDKQCSQTNTQGFLHGRKETILGKVNEQLQVTLTFLIFVDQSNSTFFQLQKQKHHNYSLKKLITKNIAQPCLGVRHCKMSNKGVGIGQTLDSTSRRQSINSCRQKRRMVFAVHPKNFSFLTHLLQELDVVPSYLEIDIPTWEQALGLGTLGLSRNHPMNCNLCLSYMS